MRLTLVPYLWARQLGLLEGSATVLLTARPTWPHLQPSPSLHPGIYGRRCLERHLSTHDLWSLVSAWFRSSFSVVNGLLANLNARNTTVRCITVCSGQVLALCWRMTYNQEELLLSCINQPNNLGDFPSLTSSEIPNVARVFPWFTAVFICCMC